MSEPILSVNGLKKHFPIYRGVFRTQVGTVKAVDGVDLRIAPGEVVGLVGESGCGKSTLARTVMRLVEPTAGSIEFMGQDFCALRGAGLLAARRNMQMVFQDPYASLNPRKSIGESLSEPLLYHAVVESRQEARRVVAAVLKQVGLSSDVMNRYPHMFSGGQQQRICIGRAIALRPKLLVLDEAVSALDVSVQAQILNLLHQLKQELSLSYLFISHDLSVVKHICDRVVVLYMGKVVEEAPVEKLFADPQHPYTQALLSAIPVEHPSQRKGAKVPQSQASTLSTL